MKSLCVTESRSLELRDIPAPTAPPSGYINVRITAASINHGDITFLKQPAAALKALASGERIHEVWGASAAGTVLQVGANVPSSYSGRKVAIYRGLKPDDPALGLWCEIVQVPWETCCILPDGLDAKDYSGSLVNIGTAYAFLEQAIAEGHKGILVTAGNSATGRAMVVLARRRGIPILAIVRSDNAKEDMVKVGVEAGHVLSSSHPDFLHDLEQTARQLSTTAVFDGVGGALISKMLPALAPQSTVFFYGFLSGAEMVQFHSAVFMPKNLSMKRFSNFHTVTVKDKLGEMLRDLEECVENTLFRTSIGKEFKPEEIKDAMAYEGGGKKAAVIFSR